MQVDVAIYFELEKNKYLNEIYSELITSYALKYLSLENSKLSFNVSHALRFADILSKSTDVNNSELHKNIAQEMVSLLQFIFPENKLVNYCMGSVLNHINNYRGADLQNDSYESADIFEKMYDNVIKKTFKIPCEKDKYFFKAQKDVYNNFQKNYYSYSGPTSMGKSFVIRMFLKNKVMSGVNENIAIVVPTKALINEVSSNIIMDLKDLLKEKNFCLITSFSANALKENHNFIFVLTPERLLYMLVDNKHLKLDYLFIDEAQKISSKDKRSPFYYKIIDIIGRKNDGTHIIFSSPNIPNPEIYLELIPNVNVLNTAQDRFKLAPVSQMKFIVDLVCKKIYMQNNLNKVLQVVCSFDHMGRIYGINEFILQVGRNSKNIVYCSSTTKAVELAKHYANLLPITQIDERLKELIRSIQNEIHKEYYLVDVLSKGVAYHIGYLPAIIRQQIEELYKIGVINTVFCTSTLLEGINLPADNLFVTSYKIGRSNLQQVDFRNLVGRVGRIEYNLYGNVFLMICENEEQVKKKYEDLLLGDIKEQTLSIKSELSKKQKELIISSLQSGDVELEKYPKSQSAGNYALMRKFSIMLLNDILRDNKSSYVIKQFGDVLDILKIRRIKEAFANVLFQVSEDINVSIDQLDNLTKEIYRGLKYPTDFDFNTSIMPFLIKLSAIFKWKKYEENTLGNNSILKWYAVILSQWMQGYGLSQIIFKAIEHKFKTSGSTVYINFQKIPFDNSKEHKNIVITDTLNIIEDVILFKLSNYFMKFSMKYKEINQIEKISNDWYEYIEYGTTNELTIFLQKNGFSREIASYIKNNPDYVVSFDGKYKLSKSILSNKNLIVYKECMEMYYNNPQLFV